MKTLTFSAREMSRQTAKVLAAAKRYGSVKIRTREGSEFTLALKATSGPGAERDERLSQYEARREKFKKAGWTPLPASEVDRFNRIIAGED